MDDCAPVKHYGCEGMWLLDEGFTEGRLSAAFTLPAKNLSNSAGKIRRETTLVKQGLCKIDTLLTVVYYTFTTVTQSKVTHFYCSADYLLFFFGILKGNLRS